MSESPSLFGTPREWATDLAIATAIGVFLGMIGPFGSFNGGPPELRIAYWVVNMWIGFIVLSTVVRTSLRVGIGLDLPIWFTLAVGVAIGALPLGYIVGAFSSLFWPGNHGRMSPLLIQYGQTLVISEPCAFGYYFLADRGWRSAATKATQPAGQPGQAASEAGSGFLDRLPPRLGRELLCLQMEDHYVRAHTDRGSDLILTPLKDAIAELGDTDGLQVHRSWWVARRAVAEPVANGRSFSLKLTNGLDVPVSRASVAKLRAAGWLGPG
ncbi:MAG TPA: LytTR family DNA-binding domain-containing protein [Caulobacteraceae bacterium]|jgi:hypothetical protein